jgi:hypothetical protein
VALLIVARQRRIFWFASRKTESKDDQQLNTLGNIKNNNNYDHQSRPMVNIVAAVDINLNAHVILASDLQLGEEIGRGSSGVVYKATWRATEVAMKQLLSSKQMSTKEIRDFIAEISLMASLRPHGKSEFVLHQK